MRIAVSSTGEDSPAADRNPADDQEVDPDHHHNRGLRRNADASAPDAES